MAEIQDYGLDLHCQMILEDYRDKQPVYEKMQEIVMSQIRHLLDENGIYVTAFESRIKTEKSLAGKLELKGHKYRDITDITDILGARVITFYTDEVDKMAALVENNFEVDWNESVDKRKMHSVDSFGYMSLHYICRIPASLYSDPSFPELNIIRFEIQMRTALQHVWANMNHDIGYKSGVEVPQEHLRNLTRLAGMLELADEQFSLIRKNVNDYRRSVQSLVSSGNFDEVPLDGDTFKSYMNLFPFKKLIEKIASINQAEIYIDNLMPYLEVFKKLGFTTLGDIEKMKKTCFNDAFKLALHQIGGTDLDIIALSVSVQNLCSIHILKNGGGVSGLENMFNLLGGNEAYNSQRAKRIFDQAKKINLI